MWGCEKNYQRRGFVTPPAKWRQNREIPAMPISERRPKNDSFHIIHKVPSGHSPYVKAKHVQLIEKDPSRAISLFWAAINAGDRVESALKDMAVVMKQLDRSEEAIEAIKSFRHLCPHESQDSLDNVLLELYKSSGRIQEEIEMLQLKLKHIEEGMAYGGKQTRIARSQGRKVQISIEKEYSRLLGNLAWVFMQQKDYKSAEESYRKALSLEPDKNKQCNLAICLIHMNKIAEARFLLRTVQFSADNGADESYAKSFERAVQMIDEIESQTTCNRKSVTFESSPSPFTQPRSRALQCSPRSNHGGEVQSSSNTIGRFRLDSSRKLSFEKPVGQLESSPSPCTQPRRSGALQCSVQSSTTTGRWLEQDGDHFHHKLSFEKPVGQLESRSHGGGDCQQGPSNLRSSLELREIVRNSMENLKATQHIDESNSMENLEATQNLDEPPKPAPHIILERERSKKSWADMVEEDCEQEKEQCGGKYDQRMTIEYPQEEYPFYRTPNRFCKDQQLSDENADANVIVDSEPPVNHYDPQKKDAEKTESSLSDDPECGGYCTHPGNHVRRSLTFPDQQHQNTIDNKYNPSSPLEKKVENIDTYSSVLSGGGSSNSLEGVGVRLLSKRSRLQVFRDISPESPRAS
ncbi:hypothetical protein LIER_25213 [Lithospermum erythrorhizon]|uniref:Uncharacterized protein n=1 Tax=Lithospermum erythrorhizon TaxID=34254 RepID=A0AAV3R566_LITER